MNRNRLQEILKGLLKCTGLALALAAAAFVLIPLVLFVLAGLLLSPLIQQMPR